MNSIKKAHLKKFILESEKKLEGDWVVIGGTVLPLLGAEMRPTIDIDMIPLSSNSANDSLSLMEIAENIGLPIEAINMAGAYFFNKLNVKKSQLISIYKGKNFQLLVPGLHLFIQLKINRLSESDLEDCILAIKHFNPTPLEKKKLAILLKKKMKSFSISQIKRAEFLLKQIA